MDQQNQNQTTSFSGQSQTQPVTTKHYRSFWPIVIIATLSAIIGGLIVWAAFNAGLDEELNSLLPGADRRFARQQRNLALEPMTTQAGANWKQYKNEDFGFELTFNDAWKDVKVVKQEMGSNFGAGSIVFLIPTSSKIYSGAYPGFAAVMTIGVYNSEYWNKLIIEEGPKPSYLGQNEDGFVFAYYGWQDSPDDLLNINFDLNNIAKTFKLTK